MASLDVFIVNVAFDAIGADFAGAGLGKVAGVNTVKRFAEKDLPPRR